MNRIASVIVAAVTALLPVPLPAGTAHTGDARQLVEVTGRSWTSTYATLRAYTREGDGPWREAFPAVAARIGYGGWQWAARRVQDTGQTPVGTFTLTEAFGLSADPGSRLPYRQVGPTDYWAGDSHDPRTYNVFQPSAPKTRTWRISQSERLADYPRQYAYAAVIDFNRPVGVHWDAARKEYVTATPSVVGRGAAIFLHVNGAGSTAGCVSVSSADMVRLLRWLDPASKPRIVMGPGAVIGRA